MSRWDDLAGLLDLEKSLQGEVASLMSCVPVQELLDLKVIIFATPQEG